MSFHAMILRIHHDGSTSSIVGNFDSLGDARDRARNDIEYQPRGAGIVATLVLATGPIAHFEAVEDRVRLDGTMRYRAEVAVGFKEAHNV